MKVDYAQLAFIHPLLREILADAEDIMEPLAGEPVITSLYRIGDDGVHGQLPLRGVDLRCRDETIGNQVASRINQRWQYDVERKWLTCAMYHDAGAGAHLHLQVHENTTRMP